MRILYCIDKMVRAGAQNNLCRIIRGIGQYGHEPFLCCLLHPGPLGDELAAEGFPVFSAGLPGVVGADFFRAVGFLRRICLREEIRLVHSFLFAANITAPFAAVSARRRVITSRCDDGFWKKPRHVLANRIANLFTDRITGNSEGVAAYLRDRERVRPGRFLVIPNGVSLPAAVERVSAGGVVRIGCLGNIRPVKGYEHLLAALALLRERGDWETVIAGRVLDPEYARGLEESVLELGLAGRVSFSGEAADPADFLRGLDIFVLPSLSEGFSNSLLEALAAGLPVVAAAVGGNPEVIRPGTDGLLVPPADARALARALEGLLDSAAFRAELSTGARSRAGDFGLPRMLGQLDRLYRETAGEG